MFDSLPVLVIIGIIATGFFLIYGEPLLGPIISPQEYAERQIKRCLSRGEDYFEFIMRRGQTKIYWKGCPGKGVRWGFELEEFLEVIRNYQLKDVLVRKLGPAPFQVQDYMIRFEVRIKIKI